MHVAVIVAHPRIAQRYVFHQTGLAAGLDDVTVAHLVLEQQKEAVEIVLDQTLRAETHRHADHAGGAQNGRHRDAQFAQYERAGDNGDDDGGNVTKYATERLDALHILDIREIAAQIQAQHAYRTSHHRQRDPGEDQNQQDAAAGFRDPQQFTGKHIEVPDNQIRHPLSSRHNFDGSPPLVVDNEIAGATGSCKFTRAASRLHTVRGDKLLGACRNIGPRAHQQ